MLGGKIIFSTFNKNSKKDWFFADLGAMFDLVVLISIVEFVLGILFQETTEVKIFGFWPGFIIPVFAVIPVVTAFITVFVLRKNMFVIGDRRQFRYIFSWL